LFFFRVVFSRYLRLTINFDDESKQPKPCAVISRTIPGTSGLSLSVLSHVKEGTVAPFGAKRGCFDANELEPISTHDFDKPFFDSFWKFRCWVDFIDPWSHNHDSGSKGVLFFQFVKSGLAKHKLTTIVFFLQSNERLILTIWRSAIGNIDRLQLADLTKMVDMSHRLLWRNL
jgi:hypothetical protein